MHYCYRAASCTPNYSLDNVRSQLCVHAFENKISGSNFAITLTNGI